MDCLNRELNEKNELIKNYSCQNEALKRDIIQKCKELLKQLHRGSRKENITFGESDDSDCNDNFEPLVSFSEKYKFILFKS